MNNSMVAINKPIDENKADNIKNLIYYIRGKQVMLDSDVAMIYKTETRAINQAVKRNIKRFPEDFGFQLTDNEFLNLRSQIVILNSKPNNGKVVRKYNPYVFTEQGIVMLSALLRSETAIKTSVKIVEAFVEMRMFLNQNNPIFSRLTCMEYKLLEHDNKINQVFNELQKDRAKEFKEQIFFKGQIWDSYELLIDIIRSAKNKIIIIDNNELYHCGASLKDLGKKCFAINKMEGNELIENILKIIKPISQIKI